MIPASQDFINALKNPVKQIWIKLEFFTSSMNFIDSFEHKVTEKDLGHISVDTTKDVQRSFTFSLINTDGTFIWGQNNLVWLDKRIKLYIGLTLADGTVEYVPQGVFVLTEPEDTHEPEDEKCTIKAADKTYLLTGNRGKFTTQTTIAAGTPVTTAIQTIAGDVGETLFSFDPGITTTLYYDVTYRVDETRWKAIQDLANMAKCFVYYDVYGYLRLKQINLNDLQNYAPVWTFDTTNSNEIFYAGNQRKLDDKDMANHIVVIGGGSTTGVVSDEIIVDETNPLWTGNPYSIQKLGHIIYIWNNGNADPALLTQQDCHFRAKYELMQKLGYTEELDFKCAPIYLLEGDDIVSVNDPANNVNGNYLIESFELPIQPDLMTIKAKKQNLLLTNWNSF